MTTTKFTTAAILVATGAALPLSLQWADMARGTDRFEAPNLSEVVSGGPAAQNPDQALGNEPSATTASQRPASGLDLRLLERELRKLPFPNGDIKRELDLERLMFQLNEDEVPAVAALIQRLEPKHLGKITLALFARWAEFAPDTAAQVAEEMGENGLIYSARNGVMGTWAATDPASALKYLETHPNGTKVSSMVWATIGDMVDRDPHEALTMVSDVVSDEAVVRNVHNIIVEAWGDTDPDAALAWAGNLDEVLARSHTKTIINRLASDQPAKAFQLAIESDHPSIRAGSARWTLMQWLHQDPLAAAEAYASMPAQLYEDEQMMRTSVMLSSEAAKRDPEKAIWVAGQIPEGPARNRWVYGTAWAIAAKAPEQAASLAESLPKSGGRGRVLQRIGKEWLSKDPEPARHWIEHSGNFGSQAIEKLLSRPNP